MSRSFSLNVTTHVTFSGYKHRGSGDKVFLICLVILQDHVIKWLCEFLGRSCF